MCSEVNNQENLAGSTESKAAAIARRKLYVNDESWRIKKLANISENKNLDGGDKHDDCASTSNLDNLAPILDEKKQAYIRMSDYSRDDRPSWQVRPVNKTDVLFNFTVSVDRVHTDDDGTDLGFWNINDDLFKTFCKEHDLAWADGVLSSFSLPPVCLKVWRIMKARMTFAANDGISEQLASDIDKALKTQVTEFVSQWSTLSSLLPPLGTACRHVSSSTCAASNIPVLPTQTLRCVNILWKESDPPTLDSMFEEGLMHRYDRYRPPYTSRHIRLRNVSTDTSDAKTGRSILRQIDFCLHSDGSARLFIEFKRRGKALATEWAKKQGLDIDPDQYFGPTIDVENNDPRFLDAWASIAPLLRCEPAWPGQANAVDLPLQLIESAVVETYQSKANLAEAIPIVRFIRDDEMLNPDSKELDQSVYGLIHMFTHVRKVLQFRANRRIKAYSESLDPARRETIDFDEELPCTVYLTGLPMTPQGFRVIVRQNKTLEYRTLVIRPDSDVFDLIASQVELAALELAVLLLKKVEQEMAAAGPSGATVQKIAVSATATATATATVPSGADVQKMAASPNATVQQQKN